MNKIVREVKVEHRSDHKVAESKELNYKRILFLGMRGGEVELIQRSINLYLQEHKNNSLVTGVFCHDTKKGLLKLTGRYSSSLDSFFSTMFGNSELQS